MTHKEKVLHDENSRLRKRLRQLESISSDDENSRALGPSPISKFVRGRFTRGNRISRLKRAYTDTTNKMTTMVKSNIGFNHLKEKSRTDYELLSTFTGHKDAIQELQCSKYSVGVFGSASLDRKAKIWSQDNDDCISTYIGHHGAVNTIQLLPQVNVYFWYSLLDPFFFLLQENLFSSRELPVNW